jgi:hypothetical protein
MASPVGGAFLLFEGIEKERAQRLLWADVGIRAAGGTGRIKVHELPNTILCTITFVVAVVGSVYINESIITTAL